MFFTLRLTKYSAVETVTLAHIVDKATVVQTNVSRVLDKY